jgi:hypothetical protein
MGKVAAVASSVLFLVALANAEVPSGNAFIGYSYYNGTNLPSPLFGRATTNGWEASIEGKILPFVGLVADFDGHFGSETVSTCGQGCGPFRSAVSQYNDLFGPRVSVSVAKIRPFAEVLIGGGHVNVHLLSSNSSFATAVGGGFDYKVLRLIGWRCRQTTFTRISSAPSKTMCVCRPESSFASK